MTMQDPGVPPAQEPGSDPEPAQPATSAASSAASAQAAAASFVGRLGLAEQLALGGAALIVIVEIVFGLLLDEYWAGDIAFLLGLAVLAAAFIRHARGGEVPIGYVTVIRVAGFAVLALAIVDLVYELRHGVFDNGADILGGALYYVGAGLMAAGAWTLREG
jgi:hypothetical protein